MALRCRFVSYCVCQAKPCEDLQSVGRSFDGPLESKEELINYRCFNMKRLPRLISQHVNISGVLV